MENYYLSGSLSYSQKGALYSDTLTEQSVTATVGAYRGSFGGDVGLKYDLASGQAEIVTGFTKKL